MCATCGCEDGATATVTDLDTGAITEVRPHAHGHDHDHNHGHDHPHGHGHDHAHEHDHDHDHAHPRTRTVELEARVLAKNDALAARNRAWFAGREILALNLVSSPGAGKTTLLERTIREAKSRLPLYVVEGDQETANDAVRIRAAGAPVVQLNTGTGCHLEADMVARGVAELRPEVGGVVFIENVGNLVCPALFDLGEQAKVLILSVAEGDDKPLKYPFMFRAARLLLLNKIDLLPHVDFDVAKAAANARAVNPALEILEVSARTGEGLESWYAWLQAASAVARGGSQ